MKKTILTYQYKDGSPSVPVYIDDQGFFWKPWQDNLTPIYWENLHQIMQSKKLLSNYKKKIYNVYCCVNDIGICCVRFASDTFSKKPLKLEDILAIKK